MGGAVSVTTLPDFMDLSTFRWIAGEEFDQQIFDAHAEQKSGSDDLVLIKETLLKKQNDDTRVKRLLKKWYQDPATGDDYTPTDDLSYLIQGPKLTATMYGEQQSSPRIHLIRARDELQNATDDQTKIAALTTLSELSSAEESRRHLASSDLELLVLLRDVIHKAVITRHHPDVAIKALDLLQDLLKWGREAMSSKELDLISVLCSVTHSDNISSAKAHLKAIDLLFNLRHEDPHLLVVLVEILKTADSHEHLLPKALHLLIDAQQWAKEHIAHDLYLNGLVPALVAIIGKGTTNGHTRVLAIDLLMYLSFDDDVKISMASQDLGLLIVLTEFIRSTTTTKVAYSKDAAEGLEITLDFLSMLCTVWKNKRKLASASVGLLPVLMKLIQCGCGNTWVQALEIVKSLAVHEDNQSYMASQALGLVPVLMKALQSNTEVVRLWALECLRFLSSCEEKSQQVYLASRELGLLPLLMTFIDTDAGNRLTFPESTSDIDATNDVRTRNSKSNIRARTLALTIVSNLADEDTNIAYMASSSLGLVPLLIEVSRVGTIDARLHAVMTLRDLAKAPENLEYLASPALGLLDMLVHLLSTDIGKVQVWILSTLSTLAVTMEITKLLLADGKLLPLLRNFVVHHIGGLQEGALHLFRLLVLHHHTEMQETMRHLDTEWLRVVRGLALVKGRMQEDAKALLVGLVTNQN